MPTDSDKKIYLSLGLAEGGLVSRKFKKAAHARGFTFTKQKTEADYAIGHSAGCYNLNDTGTAKIVILIGPPTLSVNSKTVIKQINQKLLYEYRELGLLVFCKKNLPNLLYILNIPRNIRLRKIVLKRQLPTRPVFFIRNQRDPFNTTRLEHHNESQHTYISLPGGHDDIWIRPNPYLDILESIHE